LQKYWRDPAKPMLWKDRYDFALQLAKGKLAASAIFFSLI
jgi:hypothetical protein